MEDELIHSTILIVENRFDIGETLLLTLEGRTNYSVLLASNGIEAMVLARTIEPALLILDYCLPDINGIELYDQLHVIVGSKKVPAIILNTDLDVSKREVAQRGLLNISRPFTVDDILCLVDCLLF